MSDLNDFDLPSLDDALTFAERVARDNAMPVPHVEVTLYAGSQTWARCTARNNAGTLEILSHDRLTVVERHPKGRWKEAIIRYASGVILEVLTYDGPMEPITLIERNRG